MRTARIRIFLGRIAFFVACGITAVVSAQTRTIRAVTYNIQADTTNTTPNPGLIAPSSGGSVTNGGVLEGIGEEILGQDQAQPIDILALQETTSNTTTVQPIVDGLNAFYSSRNIPAGYAMSPYQATSTGGTGGGPNAMVYNTNTLQLVASVGVGTPGGSSNGEYRQVVRYEFAPAGVTPTTNNVFYVYTSHMKSGTSASDMTARNEEATIIRNDSATLPGNARILYTGDFNTSTSSEADYQTLVAPGVNQAFDPLNPSGVTGLDWGSSTTDTNILATLSESAKNLRFRDDYQMMTSNVFYSVAGALAYVSGTYHAFGNNGTTPYNGNVNSGSNTSLNNDLTTNVTGITATQLYQYLTTASDHLPVVADYTITTLPCPSPQSIQTVFIIPMENQDWSSIKGSSSAPYINNILLPMASHAEDYETPPSLITYPSLPNYLWLEAGTNLNVTSDVTVTVGHQTSTNHLVTLLKNAGISWRSYQEDIPGNNCPTNNVNKYLTRHNPVVYFDDVTCNYSMTCLYCTNNIRPYTELATDLAGNTVARYNWITPNSCDDMHDSSGCATGNQILNGDTWLSNNIPAILNSQAYSNNGAIFIIWDEPAGNTLNPIGMIVLSPLAKGGGYSNTNHYTHSSTLLTMQEIFNVTPLLGDTVNAIDLSDLFVFAPQLSVTPASGLTSSGQAGGPFSPGSQTYTLSNTGCVALVWSASETVNWLDLSATSGTLAAGDSTNITVSINSIANSLSGGGYSDTVSFTTSNGSGNTTRPVSLTVNNSGAQISVTPSSGFSSAGPPGGPFSPSSQTYAVSNSGNATMSWTANKTATWLDLSATSGTLAPAASVNVIASINGSANSLAAGSYPDTIGFTNTTNGVGNTTRAVSLNVSTFGFCDDFSTFASGNLVGQNGWNQLGTSSTRPLQVTNGVLAIPRLPVSSGDNQDAYKSLGSLILPGASPGTTNSLFVAMSITVTSAPTGGTAYFMSIVESNNGTGFADFRIAATNVTASTYKLGTRVNGETGYPFTFGAALNYGQQYTVILEADLVNGNANDRSRLYVNPTSSDITAQTPYVTATFSSGTVGDPSSLGAVNPSQFTSSTISQSGVLIGRLGARNNFAEAYNCVAGVVPPVASFTASPTSGVEPLAVTFTDSSTGTSPLSLSWNLGDTTTNTAGGASFVHTYPAGTYTVSLTASNVAGTSSIVSNNLITALTAFQAWQIQYFGSTNNPAADPNADPDGDGQNNMAEFLTGTDPTNSALFFGITAITTESDDVRVTWMSAIGKTNALDGSVGDAGGGYSNNFAAIFTVTNAVGTTTNYLDIGGATNVPARYYRIRLVP